jgi:hypothetical protein
MSDAPPIPPGHWVQCTACHRFFKNEQGLSGHFQFYKDPAHVEAKALFEARPHRIRRPRHDKEAEVQSPEPAVQEAEQPQPPPDSSAPQPEPNEAPSQAAATQALAEILAKTPPRPDTPWFVRLILLAIVLGLLATPLIVAIQQRRATPQEPHVFDAARIRVASPPPVTTGDAYWDRLLGYGGTYA